MSRFVHQMGHNTDVDIASTPEDVWDGGGVYPFPASAIELNAISSSVNDAAAGTGARTIRVEYLDSDYKEQEVDITMNGTTQVLTGKNALRVIRAFVLTAGSAESNDGNIDIRHTTTVIGQIGALNGHTLMAIYTVPADVQATLIKITGLVALGVSGNEAQIQFQVREKDGAWRALMVLHCVLNAPDIVDFSQARSITLKPIPARSDIRMRVTSVDANDLTVFGRFDLATT